MSRNISRRLFVGASAAAGTFASRAFAKDLAPARLGAELYTVRSMMPKDDDAVLHALAKIGYRELEGDYPTLMRIAQTAKLLGLTMPSCHIPTDSVLGENYTGTPLDKILSDLKGIGVEYAVIPYIGEEFRNRATLDAFGGKMNKAGETAKKAGLQLAYHNHAFEWADMEGKRTFDRMFGNTDPKLVQLEVDVFWLSVAGLDPVKFLNEHAGRVALVHLKDKAAAQQVQFNERVPHETFKELGSGNVDLPGVLKAAEKIGVKHYFVEQDWTPGDPVASLKQSFTYISGLRG